MSELTIDRPITGDPIKHDRSVVDQLSAADFIAQIDELLALDHVTAVVWDQYTPYFNDGDPCIFSIHDFRVRIDVDQSNGEEDDEDSYTEYEDGTYSTYDLYTYKEKGDYSDSNKVFEVKGIDTKEIYDTLQNLNKNSGAYEHVVLENFGDHAQVTATPEGFEVEYYEHD